MPQTQERDIAEAEQLFAETQDRGTVPLPQLTDVDLCVFSESFFSVLDDEVWQRWLGLAEAERVELAQQALGFLEYRKLLRRIDSAEPGGEPSYNIQPKLGFILGARKQPQFVGICSVPGQLRVGDLRLFGLRDEVHPDPIVLLERSTARGLGSLGRIRQYALATPDAAGGVAADWMRESFESDPGAGAAPRLLEIYWTPENEPLKGERLSVSTLEGQFSLTHTQGTALVCADRLLDQRDLASYLAARLRAARG
ncbi:MAG TPA: hypothetical protein VG317_18010 [Pseudonocardiaceae bacterium]|jgi:hypothetical protein|nr:hypothetical protein [Pseudonocardiaceae bacterium]